MNGQSDTKLTLNYDLITRVDLNTDEKSSKITSSKVIIDQDKLSITVNNESVNYLIITNSFEKLYSEDNTEYITYQILNIGNNTISRCYHIYDEFYLQENEYLFIFFKYQTNKL